MGKKGDSSTKLPPTKKKGTKNGGDGGREMGKKTGGNGGFLGKKGSFSL
jgi:hypothetical protein